MPGAGKFYCSTYVYERTDDDNGMNSDADYEIGEF